MNGGKSLQPAFVCLASLLAKALSGPCKTTARHTRAPWSEPKRSGALCSEPRGWKRSVVSCSVGTGASVLLPGSPTPREPKPLRTAASGAAIMSSGESGKIPAPEDPAPPAQQVSESCLGFAGAGEPAHPPTQEPGSKRHGPLLEHASPRIGAGLRVCGDAAGDLLQPWGQPACSTPLGSRSRPDCLMPAVSPWLALMHQ